MQRFSPPRNREEAELLIAPEPTPISEVVPSIEVKAEPESDMELTIDTSGEDGTLPVISPTVSETTTIPAGDTMLSLKWNGFQHHIVESLVTLFQTEELADVTLIADNGEPIKAHKVVLALSSPYFRKLFRENPCKHPIIVLQGVRHEEVVQVMNFIYKGQVRVCENEFDEFMEAAESLRIDGINAHPSNSSDEAEGSPSTRSPVHGGASPRPGDDPQSSNPWQGFTAGLQPPFDDTTATSPIGPGITFRKRSSVSSGISSATAGSLNEHRGVSAPSSPQNLQQQTLENTIIAAMKPSEGPMLIEIDEDESRWDFGAPSPSSQLSRSALQRHQQDYRDIPVRVERTCSLVAEDLSKSRLSSEEYEQIEAFRANRISGAVRTPSTLSYKQEKRSTSWPLEATSRPQPQSHNALANALFTQMTTKGHFLPPVNPRYFPLVPTPGTLPRPIPHHPLHPFATAPGNSPVFGMPTQTTGSSLSDTRHGSPDEPRLKRPRQSPPYLPGRYNIFGHGSPAHFLAKYGMSPGNATTALKFTKPKTKAIRSSQVPQSARYTASQVDSMVEKVENFPGPLVPCIVCQKFVKRERLRAHIHECHLLPEEKIECPICKIGLKSKGSFRVHLWRHRRSKAATEGKSKELPPTTSSF